MDCTNRCRLLAHADYILSVVTKENLEDFKSFASKRCGNALRIVDKYGRNILHIAAACGKKDILEWVLSEADIDIYSKDAESGWTPLHRAFYYGFLDSAVLLLKCGASLYIHDKEGLDPLEIIHLDIKRTCKQREGKGAIKVKCVMSWSSLKTGNLEQLRYGDEILVIREARLGWSYGRMVHTNQEGLFPNCFVEFPEADVTTIMKSPSGLKEVLDLYMWGINSNYNLGQGDARSRDKPELVMELWKLKLNIKQVAISKFHSVILTHDGHVYTCGHGRGGRLGHGNEDTILYPKRVKGLEGVYCVQVAAAHDHSLVLDEMGHVYSFGLNSSHQLGIIPNPKQCQAPTQIFLKSLKGKIMVGIAAGRFHSVIFTHDEVYTFGLNAGQLGHPKGEDFQTVPKLVSALQRKEMKIDMVAATDGATICTFRNGDIYLLQQYQCRKIATRMSEIKSSSCSGGGLDAKFFKNLDLKEPEKLQLTLLHKDGALSYWNEDTPWFRNVIFCARRVECAKVVDIAQGKHLMVVTGDGLVYECTQRTVCKSAQKASAVESACAPRRGSSSSFSLQAAAEEYSREMSEQHVVDVRRIPLIYRACKVFSDSKSRNFAAIQGCPSSSMKTYPTVSRSSFKEDLNNLLDLADLSDNIHDIVLKGKGFFLPAHQFIICATFPSFNFEAVMDYENQERPVLHLPETEEKQVRTWLSDVYEGNARYNILKKSSQGKARAAKKIVDSLEEDLEDTTSLINSMSTYASTDLEVPTLDDASPILNEEGVAVRRLPKSTKKDNRKKEKNMNTKEEIKNGENTARGKDKRQRKQGSMKPVFADWKNMLDLADITIEASDGIVFECHKCILIARLEYFQSMLGNEWIESSLLEGSLKMPIPGRILDVILDYLYTDEIDQIKDCEDVEYLGDVIIYADQFLINRLKEICEQAIAKQITIKNALEMLEFSCMYNAEQLKEFACEFICLNLCYYVESRLLESLSSESLEELSKSYRNMVPGMEYRIMTPSFYHIEVDESEMELSKAMLCSPRRTRRESEKAMKDFSNKGVPPNPEASPEKSTVTKKDSARMKKSKAGKSSRKKSESDECIAPVEAKTPVKEKNVARNAVPPNKQLEKVLSPSTETVNSSGRGGTSPESKMENPLKWASQAVQNQNSLRSIIAEEELSVTTTPRGRDPHTAEQSMSPKSPKSATPPKQKWGSTKKKSQKERKMEMLELKKKQSEVETKDEVVAEKEAVKPFCPWASVKATSSPVQSFKEVMRQETRTSPESEKSDDAVTKGVKIQQSRKRSTSKPDIVDGSPSNGGTWRPSLDSPRAHANKMDFAAIMDLQRDEKEELTRRLRKPLTLIQIEENAIEELRVRYRAENTTSEYITVTRVTSSVASPVWDVHKHFSSKK